MSEDLSTPEGQAQAIRQRHEAGIDVVYMTDPANYSRRYVRSYTSPDGFIRDAYYELSMRNPHTGSHTVITHTDTEERREEYFQARIHALDGLPR